MVCDAGDVADIETISDTHAALEQCGDLFRADPIGSNMVAAALSPAIDFELLRVSDSGTTLGAAFRAGATCTLTQLAADAADPIGNVLPIDAPLSVYGPAGAAATVAGRWMTRTNGVVGSVELNRMYRLGTLAEPSRRRKGKVFVTDRARLDQASEWSVGFGNDTGLTRSVDDARVQMERAVNESRLIEWRVKGEVVSQLIISAARFGVVRIGQVYTPPEFRKRGHAAALTAAVSAQQLERQKVSDIILTTQASNPSTNRLYRRVGFEPAIEMLQIDLVPGLPHAD